MRLSELEANLHETRKRWKETITRDAPLEERVAAGQAVLQAERALSLAQGEENEPDPEWDGSYVTEMRTMDIHRIVLVEFIGSYAFQFGGPNDEVIGGHRLWGRGLNPYSAHVIANSRWLAEMEQINKVHPRYHPDKWKTLKHYLLLFHDENFECLARGLHDRGVTGQP